MVITQPYRNSRFFIAKTVIISSQEHFMKNSMKMEDVFSGIVVFNLIYFIAKLLQRDHGQIFS